MALPYFANFGWEPLILKVDPSQQEGIKDPLLCSTVPADTRTWQADCVPIWATRWAGVRNVGLRSFFHLARIGNQIVETESPNVAFFSTTMFPLMAIGRYWHHRHGLPYVLDFQDPWRKKIRGIANRTQKAGLKSWLADLVADVLEPLALRRVSHIISVSKAYVADLRSRYSWLGESALTVLPFGAAAADYAALERFPIKQSAFDPSDGRRHCVYVGVSGPYMTLALNALFGALAKEVEARPNLRESMRFHFIGTDYAPRERARKSVERLAAAAGLADIVQEQSDRIPYLEALQCLRDAEALIVPGSDDPGYTASKLFTYILARKPLLAIFHEESSVVDILRKTRAGMVVTFRSQDSVETISERIIATGWLQSPSSNVPCTDWSAFEPYSAREMTRRLCQVFDQCSLQ
jgi:glycosyltransferase involved in cell wall biosynthesis